ncbi:unnamed protein product [Meganyctiphanes norvegica]|uniref:C2H2-type domain-containing protein n=1 Tax=Meganyctiphanes norvegica TaxID=48144 RepID=A0AAV2PW49_MEGNR
MGNVRYKEEIPTPKWRVVPLSPFKKSSDDTAEGQVNSTCEEAIVDTEKEHDSALNDNEAAEVLIQIGQMAVCTGNSALACMDCGEQCKTKRDLKRHMLLHTGERVLECSQCNYKTNRTNRMKAHIKTHTGEKNYYCPKCDFGSIQKSNYDKHVYMFHNKKASCNECDFTCIGMYSLKEHKKIHNAKKRYACGECDYRTDDSSALKCHLTKHTKVKPAKCDQCDQSFRDNYGLKLHSLIHTGEKPYTCFKCNYITFSQEYLDKHLNENHTAPTKKISTYKIYRKCKDCGYTCKGEELFAKHLEYHEKNGPMMKCDQCDYECKAFSTMREHLLRHKTGTILRCELCNFRFLNPLMYDAHMIGHAQNELMNSEQNSDKKASKSGKREKNITNSKRKQKEKKIRVKKEKVVRKEKILSKREQKEEKMRAKKAEGIVMKRSRKVLRDANKDISNEKSEEIEELDGSFSKLNAQEDHSVSNENLNIYFCGSCNFSSHTKKELNAHIPIHSFNKHFTCLECGFCCDQHLELVTHIQSHTFSKKQTKKNEFECHTCKINFSSQLSLDNHKTEYHEKKSYDTDRENPQIDMNLPEVNENSFSQNIEYECPKCDYKHELQSKIKEHIIAYHNVQVDQANNLSENSQGQIVVNKDAIYNAEEHENSNNDLNTNTEIVGDELSESNNDDYNGFDDQDDEMIMSDDEENYTSQCSEYTNNSEKATDDIHEETGDFNDLNEFECPKCDFKSSTMENIKKHIILVHENVSPGSNIIVLPNEDDTSSSRSSPKLKSQLGCESDGYVSERDGYVSEPDDSFTLVLDDSEGSDDDYNDAIDNSSTNLSDANIKSEPLSSDNYLIDTSDKEDYSSEVIYLFQINKKSSNQIAYVESLNESSSQIDDDTSQETVNDISINNTNEQPKAKLQKINTHKSKKAANKALPNNKMDKSLPNKKLRSRYIGVKIKDGTWKCIYCEMIFERYDVLKKHVNNHCVGTHTKTLENTKTLEENNVHNESKKNDNSEKIYSESDQKDDLLENPNYKWTQNEEGNYICLVCNHENRNYKFFIFHIRKCQYPDSSSIEKYEKIKFLPTKDKKWKCSNCQCIFANKRSDRAHRKNCNRSCRCAPPIPIEKNHKVFKFPETEDGKYKCSNCNCLFLNCRSIKRHHKACMINCKCMYTNDRPTYDCPYCNCSFLRESTLVYGHIKQKKCMNTCQCTKSTTKDKHLLHFLNKNALININQNLGNNTTVDSDTKKKDCSDKGNSENTNITRETSETSAGENSMDIDHEVSENSVSIMCKDADNDENKKSDMIEQGKLNEKSSKYIESILSQEGENVNLQEENKTSNNFAKDPDLYPFECTVCKDRFEMNFELKDHEKEHNKIECEICEKSFAKKYILKKHFLRCSENIYKCEQCPFRCKDQDTLKKHSSKHDGEHACPYCGRTFKRAKSLEFHVDLHNPEKKFECNICNYKCKRAEYLRNHMSRKHSKKKRFECTQCEYSCFYSSNLRKHLQIHDPSQQVEYECPRCDYKNKLKNRIKEHIMKVHEGIQIEKRHQCPLCPFKGRDPYVLRNHILVHTGEKPYECGECDFKCSNKNQLRRHTRKHTGETFNCTLCDFQTVDKNSLQTHYITHTGVKRYVCDECDYKCNQIHRLKAHKQTHSKEKLFQCGECFKRLKDRMSLMRHLTSEHLE